MSHADLRKQSTAAAAARLNSRTSGSGSVVRNDKAMIERAVSQHESHDHPGKPKTKLKLATGGVADDRAPLRMDRARGGKGKGKGRKAHTQVNVIVPPAQPHPMPVPVPMGGPPPGAAMAGPAVPPPPGAPPMGAPPPGLGAMPPRPPMAGPPVSAGVPGMRRAGGRTGFATGGKVLDGAKPKGMGIDDGAGSGEGRLEKIRAYGSESTKKEGSR